MTFERYLTEQGHTALTIKSYLYEIAVFLKTNPQAESYKYKDIINYMNAKIADYPDTFTPHRILASIKRYYDYLIGEGKIEYHPCRTFYIKNKKSKGIIHQDLFSSEELELMMQREGRIKVSLLRNRVVISLLIYQGLTAGEILRLKTKHIDFDNARIFIEGSRDLSQRHLDIHPKQYRIFDKYINREEANQTEVFLTGRTVKPITVEDISYITGVCKYLFPERNLNPVTIRQSVIANWLNEKNLPLEQVQLMAGHRWMSSTERYKQINPNEQRELIRKWHPLG